MKNLLSLLTALFAFHFFTTNAAAQPSKEYQLKAAFLFNFAQFVKWPSDAFAGPDAPFTIGVLGDNPFDSVLEDTVRGEAIQGRKLAVRSSTHLQDLDSCQIIFVTRSEGRHIPDILSRLKGRKVLTVGETPGFAHRGGMINFYQEGTKLRFEINPSAAQQNGLKLSSQLLSLGKIVSSEVTRGTQ